MNRKGNLFVFKSLEEEIESQGWIQILSSTPDDTTRFYDISLTAEHVLLLSRDRKVWIFQICFVDKASF